MSGAGMSGGRKEVLVWVLVGGVWCAVVWLGIYSMFVRE
jgi:hypothetical protein